MSKILKIVGGTYFEVCFEPEFRRDLYGSGMRAAAALSNKGFDIELHTCIGHSDKALIKSNLDTFGISSTIQDIDKTITFEYYHPLSFPECINSNSKVPERIIPDIKAEAILYYDMVETKVSVHGEYVVYDPQSYTPFTETGSTAKHLALILNRNEAYLISGNDRSINLTEVGDTLCISANAEVVVIKNGAHGALLITKGEKFYIPVFETQKVWPIGSGDIFSAAFAWQWAILRKQPYEAAILASQFTATFCSNELLPLPITPDNFRAISKKNKPKNLYLAGPFFTMGQRFLINEFMIALTDFGNEVFSPFHELGVSSVDDKDFSENVMRMTNRDLLELQNADLIVAIVCEKDAGTLFEIGYAKALKKDVLIYSENISKGDLFMMIGSECEIVSDFTTAVYHATW